MSDQRAHPAAHQTDLDQAKQQVNTVDAVMVASRAIDPLHMGSGIRFGRTDFENHQLNDMIDMVESANPEHLETAGKALWDARDAINDAADELGGHIGRIDWEGESATAFRDWATDLVTNAYTLGLYAENVGTQITAAGTGLASVRKSMPPRDTRLAPKSVHDFATVEQVDSNKDYQAARKVEGHRQEAVNQMNRLASFYAVSEETIRGQEEPTFGKMPGMGVPKASRSPVGGNVDTDGSRSAPHIAEAVRDGQSIHHHTSAPPVTTDKDPVADSGRKLHDVITAPDRHLDWDPAQDVGTDVDGVHTVPPGTAAPEPRAVPTPAPAQGGGSGGSMPPFPAGPLAPPPGIPVGRGRMAGSSGPVVTTPRVAPPTAGPSRAGSGTGRGLISPVGRPALPGQATGRGPVPPVGSKPGAQNPAGRAPLGRSVVGGTARSAGVPAERVGRTGPAVTGRTPRVVGGKTSTPPAQGVNGSRIPRGTVVGGEPAPRASSAGERPGQGGVIGAPERQGAADKTSRTPVRSTENAIGASSGRTAPGKVGRVGTGRRSTARDERAKKSRRRPTSETE